MQKYTIQLWFATNATLTSQPLFMLRGLSKMPEHLSDTHRKVATLNLEGSSVFKVAESAFIQTQNCDQYGREDTWSYGLRSTSVGDVLVFPNQMRLVRTRAGRAKFRKVLTNRTTVLSVAPIGWRKLLDRVARFHP